MNSLTYKILKNEKEIDNEFLELLYLYYINGNEILKCDTHINKEDFKSIFIIIYNILNLKIKESELKKICSHYIKLIIADINDGNNVDLKWFINHIWYLCFNLKDELNIKTYNYCIPFIQQKLIKHFKIKENIKEKINRKIYTKQMCNKKND